jgi:hypothetical protein
MLALIMRFMNLRVLEQIDLSGIKGQGSRARRGLIAQLCRVFVGSDKALKSDCTSKGGKDR